MPTSLHQYQRPSLCPRHSINTKEDPACGHITPSIPKKIQPVAMSHHQYQTRPSLCPRHSINTKQDPACGHVTPSIPDKIQPVAASHHQYQRRPSLWPHHSTNTKDPACGHVTPSIPNKTQPVATSHHQYQRPSLWPRHSINTKQDPACGHITPSIPKTQPVATSLHQYQTRPSLWPHHSISTRQDPACGHVMLVVFHSCFFTMLPSLHLLLTAQSPWNQTAQTHPLAREETTAISLCQPPGSVIRRQVAAGHETKSQVGHSYSINLESLTLSMSLVTVTALTWSH